MAMSTYGYDAYLKYMAYQNGEIAQGERTTNAQQTNPAWNTSKSTLLENHVHLIFSVHSLLSISIDNICYFY